MEALVVVAVRLISWAVVAVVFIIQVMKPLAQLIVLLPYMRLEHFRTPVTPHAGNGTSRATFGEQPPPAELAIEIPEAEVGPSPEVQRIVKLVDQEREMAVRVLRGWMSES